MRSPQSFYVRGGCAIIASVHDLAEQLAVGLGYEAERLAFIFQAHDGVPQ